MKKPANPRALLKAFKEEVCSINDVDLDTLDWFALGVGWFLARGASLRVAYRLSSEARYTHHYWT